MEKQLLKVANIDFWPEWNFENFIHKILSKYYDIIEDSSNPDVIFHSIFNGMRGIKNYSRNIKRILVLAENWRSSRFDTDFSISFDPHSETNYRLPLWQIYLILWPELWDRLIPRKQHENFDRFCAFVVSNGSNFVRNSAFQSLNQYKPVYSYGRYMTNSNELQKWSQGRYWRDAKLEFFDKKKHKFMMAYENTPTKYYCTEKIMDAFMAGSIPIYWGDPKVHEDWNPKAFINATKLGKEWKNWVIKLDKDPEAFQRMYNESVFTGEQKKKHQENLEGFEDWLIEKIKK